MITSCAKETSCEKCLPGQPTINGLVFYAGARPVDGCEWCIKIGNDVYSPENLPVEFQLEDLNVLLSYEITGTFFQCGFSAPGLPIIHINSIKKN